jgi:hypothetical protein
MALACDIAPKDSLVFVSKPSQGVPNSIIWNEDRKLLRLFLRELVGVMAPAPPSKLQVLEQQFPGEPAPLEEESDGEAFPTDGFTTKRLVGAYSSKAKCSRSWTPNRDQRYRCNGRRRLTCRTIAGWRALLQNHRNGLSLRGDRPSLPHKQQACLQGRPPVSLGGKLRLD